MTLNAELQQQLIELLGQDPDLVGRLQSITDPTRLAHTLAEAAAARGLPVDAGMLADALAQAAALAGKSDALADSTLDGVAITHEEMQRIVSIVAPIACASIP